MKNKVINTAASQLQSRRKFVFTGLQAAGAVALLSVPAISMASEFVATSNDYTVQDIIDIILKEVANPLSKETTDTIKVGNKDAKVTGVVTTMFPSVAVIYETIRLKANFIIAHEPSFYNHHDNKEFFEKNEIVEKKLQLLNDNNITIWRAHDSIHSFKPDGITYGVVKKAGWEKYYKVGEKTFSIPASSLKDIVDHLKTKLQIKHLRVIGDLSQTCTRISLLPGAWGGKNQVNTAIQDKPDLLIVGELSEWETAEYIRDARLLGENISLVILGHAVSEEPGMEWMAEWLQPKVPGLKVTHIASNDPFIWM